MMLLTGIESQMLLINRSLPDDWLLYNRVMLQPLGAGGATTKWLTKVKRNKIIYITLTILKIEGKAVYQSRGKK